MHGPIWIFWANLTPVSLKPEDRTSEVSNEFTFSFAVTEKVESTGLARTLGQLYQSLIGILRQAAGSA